MDKSGRYASQPNPQFHFWRWSIGGGVGWGIPASPKNWLYQWPNWQLQSWKKEIQPKDPRIIRIWPEVYHSFEHSPEFSRCFFFRVLYSSNEYLLTKEHFHQIWHFMAAGDLFFQKCFFLRGTLFPTFFFSLYPPRKLTDPTLGKRKSSTQKYLLFWWCLVYHYP